MILLELCYYVIGLQLNMCFSGTCRQYIVHILNDTHFTRMKVVRIKVVAQ